MKYLKILSLWLSQILVISFNLGVQLLLARLYPQETVGVYFAVIALLNITTTIGSFGFNKYFLIIFSKYKNITTLARKKMFLLYIILNIIGILIYIIFSSIFYKEYLVFSLLLIPLYISNNLILIYVTLLQVKNDFHKISLNKLIIPLTKVLSIFFIALFFNSNIVTLSMALSLSNVLYIAYLLKEIHSNKNNLFDEKITPPAESLKLECVKNIIMVTLPYALLNLTYMLQTQGNIFLVGILEESENVALFTNAYLILIAFYIFPTVLYQNALSHRILKLLYKKQNEAIGNVIKALKPFLVYSAIIVMLTFSIVAKDFIVIIFGSNYAKSGEILQLLILSIPFRIITISNGTFMSSDFFIKKRIKIEIVVTVIGLIINAIFIGLFGISGAVVGVLLSEFMLAMTFSSTVERYFKIKTQQKRLIFIILFSEIIIITDINMFIKVILIFVIFTFLVRHIKIHGKTLKEVI